MDTGAPFFAFLQSQDWLLSMMIFASFLGSLEFYLLLLPAIYWCWDARLGFRLGLILVLSIGLNEFLKLAFHSPRPYWINPAIRPVGNYPSLGIPSGHAQDAVAFWGLLASYLKRRWAWAAAASLILVIGLSRIYLVAHFPVDVIAGWTVGLLLLLAFLGLEVPIGKRISKLSLSQKTLISFLASLGLLGLYALGILSLHSWNIPEAWTANSLAATGIVLNPISPEDTVEAAGLLFGMAIGYALMLDSGGFKADGPIKLRLMRYLLGSFGLILIWLGPGRIFYDTSLVYAADYFQAVVAGAWVAAGAPILFIKAGLAENATQ